MTPEQMLKYGKGPGLWRDGRKVRYAEPETLFEDKGGDLFPPSPEPGCWVEEEKKEEDNILKNGAFIWTEIKGAGHAFVSVHIDNSPYVFTYGRFGRTSSSAGVVGDGILNYLKFEAGRDYYREELYKMGAKAFAITDVDHEIVKFYFERLWYSGSSVTHTEWMRNGTKKNGSTIDQYDVTGVNCTTHTTKAIKVAGSKIFEGGYTTNSQLRNNYEEDFSVPISLQRYLEEKNKSSSMAVIDVTNEFVRQYPNGMDMYSLTIQQTH